MQDIRVKICGLKTPQDIAAAAEAGAAYIGFNFFAKSPRSVTPQEAAALAVEAPIGMCKVALVVNADDAMLDEITSVVPLDMIQLHGQETPERVAEVKARYGLPVMKVLGVSSLEDVQRIDAYEGVADQILVDAKAPKDAVLPGGNGVAFDWRLLAQKKYWRAPWMLAGGLNPENVAEAIRVTGARQVDVASGVESAPGEKDPARIKSFCEAANAPRR
ncbi:phosphoribosylanthranilate isomerase [Phaeobacter italicus]|jgi:phosphoribosylanthranilate isomerase|uniref:phosphoribosylanthranilate isomerase n=1 Tax=Phaeobacter italicus TaxID=481446 RepID=UPI00018703A9|nr:phosphoribosylanthranilate isomerase [Phaeobacter italicus]EEB72260.1 N-(5'phosphoribosyl)anthranilate isomerase [Ruegeria sp. R11]MEC8015551.1 phosphoribosylanthranilate isomerase [Pseudomonadota bacterium]NKX40812.1 phosphoribosylanthranilate isomerase [Rhodobacteraceae bacterium R_SAG2]NKX71427.1 phosphoribosylanthranilate isomerase [Rhodobacteraceae bacterium R_SAG1]MBY5976134.1 phosphoribosylanthranilate isomerase [Phaeobacter italicus]